jgi:hypothetical protein
MFSKKIASVLVLGSVAVLTAPSAMAATTVNGTILADNGSVAVHQQGSTFTVIPTSVAGNWPTPKNFSVSIPDDSESLKQCKIHVIAWGDGAVAQGVMAHFAGNGGYAYTGQAGSPLNNVVMSSVTHAGGTAAGQAFAIANAQSIVTSPSSGSTVFVSQPVVSGGIPGTWGPINLPANMQDRGKVKFIWNEKATSLNTNPNNYRLLSMPCSTVVKTIVPPPKPQPHVASWEIAGQFNAAQNPYEVWTYGYTDKADCSGLMIPFKNKTSTSFMNRSIDQWQRGTTSDANDLPMVGQSKGDTLLAPLKWSPNGISMHPGPQGQCAVVRFTAPAAGNYRFMGRFWAQNTSGVGNSTDTNVMVAVNSINSPIFSSNIKALGSPPTNMPFMSAGISLAAGGTIDFKVGANGNFISDSTGLHGYIQRDEP